MKKNIKTFLLSIVILLVFYILFINIFIYPCITQGVSMYPTIVPNEFKLTNRWKIVGEKYNIQRGDIVLIEKPSVLYVEKEKFNETNLIAIYDNKLNLNPFRERLMKRIVGLGGDHIQIIDNQLYINGIIIHEDYLDEEEYTNTNYLGTEYMYIDLIVPQNTIYVMGDNRNKSMDSRSFGCIPLEKIYSVVIH